MATTELETWTKGKLNPSITATLTLDDGSDLTGKTVRFQMRAEGSSVLKVDQQAQIVNAAARTVRYDWQAADLDTAGTFLTWWQITTTASGKTQDTWPEIPILVKDHADTALWLCTLQDVTSYLKVPEDRDTDVLAMFIEGASDAAQDYLQRRLRPIVTETRDVLVNSRGVALLDDYQVAGITGVTLDPTGSSPAVLAAADWFSVGGAKAAGYGIGEYLRIPYKVPQGLPPLARVAATWGWASIPPTIRTGVVMAVGMWYRREVAALTQTFALDEQRVERPESLPSAVQGLLRPWRRLTTP